MVERTDEGKAFWKVPANYGDYEDTGNSWIENAMLCDQWNIRFYGTKFCISVFRNLERKHKKQKSL